MSPKKCSVFIGTREIVANEDSHGTIREFEASMHHLCRRAKGHTGSHRCSYCQIVWTSLGYEIDET